MDLMLRLKAEAEAEAANSEDGGRDCGKSVRSKWQRCVSMAVRLVEVARTRSGEIQAAEMGRAEAAEAEAEETRGALEAEAERHEEAVGRAEAAEAARVQMEAEVSELRAALA